MVGLVKSGGTMLVFGEGADQFGTTKAVGKMLFTDYLLPFEIASILLLTAIVGAVILAKRRIDDPDQRSHHTGA